MKQVLIIILIILFNFQQTKQKTNNTDLFIINGLSANLGQFPWQAALFIRKGNSIMFCGGALISDQWVLTAGHCAEGLKFGEIVNCVFHTTGSKQKIENCFYPVSADVLLGSPTLKNRTNNSIIVKSDAIFVHENYNTITLENDIALVHLEQPVSHSRFIRPIRLNHRAVEADKTVLISGWGRTQSDSHNISKQLLFVPLKVITAQECSKFYNRMILNDGMLCARGDARRSICNGDSGGPLILPSKPPLHVGIASFTNTAGCDKGMPQGFTKTAHYYSWIEEHCHCIE